MTLADKIENQMFAAVFRSVAIRVSRDCHEDGPKASLRPTHSRVRLQTPTDAECGPPPPPALDFSFSQIATSYHGFLFQRTRLVASVSHSFFP